MGRCTAYNRRVAGGRRPHGAVRGVVIFAAGPTRFTRSLAIDLINGGTVRIMLTRVAGIFIVGFTINGTTSVILISVTDIGQFGSCVVFDFTYRGRFASCGCKQRPKDFG